MIRQRVLVAAVLASVLWIAWCILVVTTLVPRIRLRVTMWPWLLSYILCLAPVLIIALIVLIRTRPVER